MAVKLCMMVVCLVKLAGVSAASGWLTIEALTKKLTLKSFRKGRQTKGLVHLQK